MTNQILIIFGGLPSTGKTTIARELGRQIGAVHVRIDSIEQVIRECSSLGSPLDEVGYRVAYRIAEDNLRIGRTVIADSVNPLAITRDAWMEVGKRMGVECAEIEVLCSDAIEHRRRVETRTSDIPGLQLPSWQQVLSREYHPWSREHIVINTKDQSAAESVKKIREILPVLHER